MKDYLLHFSMDGRQKTNDNPKNSLTDPAIPVDSEAVLNIHNIIREFTLLQINAIVRIY